MLEFLSHSITLLQSRHSGGVPLHNPPKDFEKHEPWRQKNHILPKRYHFRWHKDPHNCSSRSWRSRIFGCAPSGLFAIILASCSHRSWGENQWFWFLWQSIRSVPPTKRDKTSSSLPRMDVSPPCHDVTPMPEEQELVPAPTNALNLMHTAQLQALS